MANSTPEVIARYFDAQSERNFDALVGLFANDGVVVDEGKTWNGMAGIRRWRHDAASLYEYTTEVRSVEPSGKNEFIARVHLAGNFPGGTVDLNYRFTVDGQCIRRLEID